MKLFFLLIYLTWFIIIVIYMYTGVANFIVVTSVEGKRSIMELSHKMVKNFCAILGMSGKLDFPQLSEVNNSGVRVSIRESRELGQPSGLIVSVATSLWLPLLQHHIFDFFKNEKARVQVNSQSHIIG